MKTLNDHELVRSMVRSIAESCAMLVQRVADLSDQVDPVEAANRQTGNLKNILQDHPLDTTAMYSQLIVDQAARTVTYRGSACFLGNTLMFRLTERLARRPNTFISFDRLIRDVWDGNAKSDEAIRSVANELRVRLRKCGMRRLASAISGQRRAYALILKQ